MSQPVLPPSSAHRWRYCSASLLMEMSQPKQEETEEARNGTAAHWVGVQYLQRRTDLPPIAPNGVEITDEMIEVAEKWCEDVFARIIPGDIVHIEHPIHIPRIHEQCRGTPDLVIISPARLKLFVDDFKFGFRPVDPEWNWQLACYTSGTLSKFGALGIHDIEWKIIQPRAYGHPTVKSWSLGLPTVNEMEVQLRGAACDALSPNPKLVASADACVNCAAAHCCHALQHATLGLTDKAFSAIPMRQDGIALGRELSVLEDAIKLMEARRDGLRGQTEAMIRAGERVPLWTVQAGPGRTIWSIPDKEVIDLGKVFGVNLAKEPKVLTPTQSGKLLSSDVVKSYSTYRNGSLKLVKSKIGKGF